MVSIRSVESWSKGIAKAIGIIFFKGGYSRTILVDAIESKSYGDIAIVLNFLDWYISIKSKIGKSVSWLIFRSHDTMLFLLKQILQCHVIIKLYGKK